MFSFLEKFSLFPYMTFWRISGKPEVNNRCAGFLSLLLILTFAAIAFTKMVEVSKMTTIYATQQTEKYLLTPYVNITTSYEDPKMEQFMFGIKLGLLSHKLFLNNSLQVGLIFQKTIYNSQNNTSSVIPQYRSFQTCTAEHFYTVPELKKNLNNWEMGHWVCLPINFTFQIGGITSKPNKQLKILIQCLDSQCQNQYYTAYAVNSFVNPMDVIDPIARYNTVYEMQMKPKQSKYYDIWIDKNTLITDESLLPNPKTTTHIGFQANSQILAGTLSSEKCLTILYLNYSGTNVIHKRNYLKLLDAFAYLGGVFNALLGAFFFMNISGCFFFQMQLADKLFKKSKLKEVTYLTHFKQVLYSILAIFKEPKWQSSKYISQLRTNVSNLLDIVYLQKRLQFLEKGMEVLLEEHQLKGLYMAYEITKEGAEANFENYEINNKFSYFLNEKRKNVEENSQKLGEGVDSAKNLKDPSGTITEIILKPKSRFKRSVLKELRETKAKELQSMNDPITVSQQIEQQSKQEQKISQQTHSMKEEDIKALLELCREAKEKKGDSRSRKIYEKIDSKVREELQEMLKLKYEMPRVITTRQTL